MLKLCSTHHSCICMCNRVLLWLHKHIQLLTTNPKECIGIVAGALCKQRHGIWWHAMHSYFCCSVPFVCSTNIPTSFNTIVLMIFTMSIYVPTCLHVLFVWSSTSVTAQAEGQGS